MQHAVKAPGDKAAADPHVTVGHQFYEADQDTREEDLRHSPAFKLEQDPRELDFKGGGHSHAVDQQQDHHQTKRRNYLNKQKEKGAEAGVIFREHHARDFEQIDLTGDPSHLHINEGEEIREQQHEQRSKSIGSRTLSWRVPLGGQGCAAAWTGSLMSVTQHWQRNEHIALRA